MSAAANREERAFQRRRTHGHFFDLHFSRLLSGKKPAASSASSTTHGTGKSLMTMTPEDHTAAIRSQQIDVADIKGTLNNGLRAMVQDQRTELATVKEDIQLIRDALTSHVAKEDVIYEIFKRVMNTGVTITGALIALLLSIIGYLLVHPVGLH
ncbi:MAG: hypothetical protein IPK78_19015 [Rhodospirillales bacterium]|nr:hypothetical protein [Rhodospirillales bacterium]